MQPGEGGVVEPAPDAPGVAERALPVVHAEQEGAEAAARAGRIREAADDELLAAAALALDPRACAPAGVRVAGALGDHALEPLQAGLGEDVAAEPLDVVAVAHHAVHGLAAAPEQLLQPALALHQRQRAQVLAVLEQQVEGDVGEVPRLPLLDEPLQAAEVADAARVEDHDLAVQPGAVGGERLEGLGDLGEPRRPVQLVAREQAHAGPVHAGGDAVAVVLDLVQPAVALRRLLDQRREAEGHGGGDAGAGVLRAAVTLRAGIRRAAVTLRAAALRPGAAPARRLAGGDLLHGAAGRDAAVVRAPRVGLARPRLRRRAP